MDATATGHWRSVLGKLDDAELFTLNEQVKEITSSPGWERIIAYISAGHDEVLRSLTVGPTRDHATQSRTLGYLAGLEEAPNVVQAIADAASSRQRQRERAAVADQQARQEETP